MVAVIAKTYQISNACSALDLASTFAQAELHSVCYTGNGKNQTHVCGKQRMALMR